MKRLALFICGFILVALASTFLILKYSNDPPSEKKLIAGFHKHRAAYERLREMLQADNQIVRIADWGVETTKSSKVSVPPDGDFPVARYNEYVRLLREIGGLAAVRDMGEGPDSLGILAWAAGFGGDTRHIEICWLQDSPQNLVVSLDDFYRTPKPRKPVFRHIDGNWYLWADW